MRKSLTLLLKLTTALFLLTFLFAPQVRGAPSCEARIRSGYVIIDLENLGAAVTEVHYKLSIHTDTCKTFNARQDHWKAFCEEVQPQQPGATSTTAQIRASAFHSGHYKIFVHYGGSARGSCDPEEADPVTKCEFDISVADGAQKCGSGDCSAQTICPADTPNRTVKECCDLIEPHQCSQGYKPNLYIDVHPSHAYTWTCRCECVEDYLAQYEPCEPIRKQCEDIDKECDEIADPEEKDQCLVKLENCQNEYDQCLACVNPPDPEKPGAWTAFGCISLQPGEFIAALIRIGFGIGGGIAFLFLIVGAFKILTSEGNPEQINDGRQMMINAIAGLFLIIFSVVVLKIIGVDVLDLPGFSS